jgi:hypothetical protein
MPALAAPLLATLTLLLVALLPSANSAATHPPSAVLGSGGGGVAFELLATGLRPYMTLQYPQHGHVFRRTTDIVVAVTVGNFTMPRDGALAGFLNG